MRNKYEQFMDEGSLVVLEGTVLDPMPVYEDLDEYIVACGYDVRCFGYDPYNAKEFVERWAAENLSLIHIYSLEKMLDDNDLTFEQKTYILDQMQEVAAAVADKDSEKSRNRLKLIGIIGGVAAAIVAALASSLGGNIALKESNDIDDDNITDL